MTHVRRTLGSALRQTCKMKKLFNVQSPSPIACSMFIIGISRCMYSTYITQYDSLACLYAEIYLGIQDWIRHNSLWRAGIVLAWMAALPNALSNLPPPPPPCLYVCTMYIILYSPVPCCICLSVLLRPRLRNFLLCVCITNNICHP